ncbi:MAG TPA: FAD-dependent oxidoreductase [Streptosporangiaceae bacterium]|nr:FAD-dependent oxidoreductase [Streptosporangiaceae bacterium]
MNGSATNPPDAGPARRDPDVLVLGAGIAGLFCAYFLRRGGASVTVLDRGPVGGPQTCSSGNTGFVGTQGAAPLAEPGVLAQGLRWLASSRSPFSVKPRPSAELASWLWQFRRRCNEADARACFGLLLEMKRRSLDILREVCAEPDLAGSFLMPGMVVAFKTAQGFDKACRSVPQAVARGVPLRVLGTAELRELEPDTDFDISGALFNAEGAALRVPEFVLAFAAMLADLGVEIVGDAEVTGFGVAGSRIERVRTAHGDFAPGEVVVATGAWSARCARLLGVRLLLQAAKGYAITVPAPPAGPRLPVLLSEGKVALMPLGDRLRFGGTLELAGLDTSVAQRRVDGIVATVRSYLPGLEISPTRQVWSGLRPCTPDSLPFLGRVTRYQNLSLACGHGYIGMGLAPVGGRMIAQVLAGEQPEMDLAPFRADRFGRA